MDINIVEILAIIIIVIGAIIGYRKGLIGIIYEIVSWIFIIVFCLATNPYITSFLKDYTPVETYVNESVSSYISDKADEYIESAKDSVEKTQDDSEADNNILGMYLPKKAYDTVVEPIGQLKDVVEEKVDETKTKVIETASNGITEYVLKGLAFVIAFIIAKTICVVVGLLIKKFRKLPVIRGVSAIIGTFVGAFNGLLVIWVIMYIVSISLTSTWGSSLFAQIQASRLLFFLYNNNLFVTMIMSWTPWNL